MIDIFQNKQGGANRGRCRRAIPPYFATDDPPFFNLVSWDSESGVMYVEDWPPILYGNFAIALKEGNFFKTC